MTKKKSKGSKGKTSQGSKGKTSQGSKGKNAQAPKKSNGSKNAWIGVALVVGVVAVVIAVSNGGSKGQPGTTPSAQEQQYAGRFLPAGYEEPTVADRTLYTATIQMTDVPAARGENGLTLPVDSVVANKIVRFDYERVDGEILPMLAYVKPSGGLFVGVSYCPPCEGRGQRIEADGTLTCESCGTKRNLETNVGISGACKLYPLDEVPSTIVGDNIVVDGAVLDTWTAQPLDRPIG